MRMAGAVCTSTAQSRRQAMQEPSLARRTTPFPLTSLSTYLIKAMD